MKRELIRITKRETAVQISNSVVKAIRNKDIVKVGARVYDEGFIGIAGQYGDDDIEDLFKRAEDNLQYKIEYPCEMSRDTTFSIKNKVTNKSKKEVIISIEDLIKDLKIVVEDLGFIASGAISIVSDEVALTNEENLNCNRCNEEYQIEIRLKEKGSPNILDTGYFYVGRELNKEVTLESVRKICIAHKNKVQIPLKKDGRVRCIFTQGEEVFQLISRELNGEQVGRKSSFFNNRFGEKIFNEGVTLYLSNDLDEEGVPFDDEGTLIKGQEDALISNGVLMQCYSDRKIAQKYEFKNTGSGFGDFDEVPSLLAPNITLKKGQKTLTELLGGEPAILVYMTGRGEFTSEGNYATSVSCGYLYEGKKIIGRIPEIALKSHIYDMYGKDFIGVPTDGLEEIPVGKLVVMDMEVN